MDEMKLKKILSEMPVPPADENARKRAVNLAVAEFKSLENKNKNKDKKSSQGISFLSRLIPKTTQTGRDPMEQASKRKLMYGGMATAMAVVLIAGVSFTQLQNIQQPEDITSTSTLQTNVLETDAKGDLAKEEGLSVVESVSPVLLENAPAPSAPPELRKIASSQMATPSKKAKVSGDASAMMRQNYAVGIADSIETKQASRLANAPVALTPSIDSIAQPGYHDEGRDNFKDFDVSPIKQVSAEPVSTFSIDVDTAAYSFVRSQLNNGVLPQKDSVRVEEMVNYFDYNYPLPETKEQPFKPTITVTNSPWNKDKKLIHIGIKGYDIEKTTRPHSNLVFLLDVSGSMNEPNKLPLLKNSLKMLLDSLNENDKVSIVVYAGAAGTVLEPTKGSDKAKIIAAIDNLEAGGSTAGAEGIALAYQLAEQNFDKEGVNRVILATDGDFNVGVTGEEPLQDFIERKRQTGIFLSVLGFGQGNYNDSMMQTLAQNGNGTAAYIDTLNEARKVLVEEASSTLFPIAKDVKIQVEFNPAQVSEYRLVGYETRALNQEDFNNDKVDAGDIGAGHAVTAIYEITPVGATPSVDPSRYAKTEAAKPTENFGDEYAFLKIRYKLPKEDTSKLITTPITKADERGSLCPPNAQCLVAGMSEDAAWSIAVAGFAQLLKGDQHVGSFTYDDVIALAQSAKGTDEYGQRAEFINLVRLAKTATAQ